MYPDDYSDESSETTFTIKLQTEGRFSVVHNRYLKTPRNGFPLILKQFLLLGAVTYSIECVESDYAYLNSDNFILLYENTMLRRI